MKSPMFFGFILVSALLATFSGAVTTAASAAGLSSGPSTEYDSGSANAVALDDSGHAVEVHVGTGRLFYRVGVGSP